MNEETKTQNDWWGYRSSSLSLEDTVNDASKCGVPDALSYLLSILFFAPSPSEQTLMNVNAVESYLQKEENLLVAIASPIR